MTAQSDAVVKAAVVDLFCGVGGLTHGLMQGGLQVVAGIDADKSCKYAYEANNRPAKFLVADVKRLTGEVVRALYPRGTIRILAGCAPCQAYSSYASTADDKAKQGKWKLLPEFARLIEEVGPEVVSMENVTRLQSFDGGKLFRDFVGRLQSAEYHVSWSNVSCPQYGIPQTRNRLVLFASKFGEVRIVPPTHKRRDYRTVRQTIGHMEPIAAGQSSPRDPLHKAAKLEPINLLRIQQSVPGGTWADWDPELLPDCYRKKSGKSYRSVYGRMEWDKPAPTITTQFDGIGRGRFGHPDQDRAISLREGALLQTFPPNYRFVKRGQPVQIAPIARHIGNAVPPVLGRIIARSIALHLEENSACSPVNADRARHRV